MKRGDNKNPKKAGKTRLDTDDQLKKLGERIKKLRIAKGYSSYEYFAYDNNISRAQFGRYEQGQDLRFSTLIKIINAFELTLPEFFGEDFD
ncbi:MAG: helix-turn-helix transcriptional regulator [Bacteroidota bacterium]|nr:helix-turn-helix transcriptional regulator [Bacteroidota bacterium]MDP4212613.1 helix-turn-helix transcriptional regulator [Bacteroidota bacterium]MDP4248681.1 helix-turn-helix transcriptional regulator [Bacteroidota bacterium]